VLKHHKDTSDPFAQLYPFYVLIETSGSDQQHDQSKLERFLEKIMTTSNSPVCDGTVAQQVTQMKSLWKLRENISESLQRDGVVYKYDVSLPLSEFYRMVSDTRQRIGSKGKVVGYGHIGDGNLHLNVATPVYDDTVMSLLEPFVYEYTAKHRGSISAEHGLGVMKPNYIHYSKADPVVQVMKKVKAIMDPNGILNPYKVLPNK